MKQLFMWAMVVGLCLLTGCGDSDAPKVIVLGIDGMDYKLTRKWMDEGKLPNFAALAREGGFSSLGTSIPPESPVAWSNFITGMNPGGHGIFDFLHRTWEPMGDAPFTVVDPVTHTDPITWELEMFDHVLPLAGGDQHNKRKGTAFWDVLDAHGIPATIFKIPANFPPTPTNQKTLSGMGTPDAKGGYGMYFVYTDKSEIIFSEEIKAGNVRSVSIIDNTIKDFLYGPENPAIAGDVKPVTKTPLNIYLDPENPLIKIVIGDEEEPTSELILKEGEWSEFVDMDFDIIPTVSVSGITRFYLKQMRPDFVLFMDPININPFTPIPDISTPTSWASELAERNGYFYTKGMPEDTKALEEGVLDYDEFRQQTTLIYEKRKDMLFDILDHHDAGFLFYYFCSIDLDSHMFWRCMDLAHPGHKDDFGNADFISYLYQDVDRTLGKIREKLGKDDTLIVMSDHGFSPWYRVFNLNTWFLDKGYAALKEDADRETDTGFMSVDWSKTKAYNLGFACIYLNVKDPVHNPNGPVDPSEVKSLTDEICSRLMQETDPENGSKVFLTMYKTREAYSGAALAEAPEIIVGFKREYRNSNESAQGMYPKELIHDNMDAWSGCHLMAAEEVPGVLFSNKKIVLENPRLYDLTVAVLKAYGIEKLPEMVGQPIFAE